MRTRELSLVSILMLAMSACGDSGSDGGGGSGGASDGGQGGTGGQPAGGAPGDGGGGAAPGLPDCEDLCPGVVAAGCANGPPTQEACVTGCEMVQAGPCDTQYAALYECAGDTPTYACTDMGQVTVEGCEAENDNLYACLAGDA